MHETAMMQNLISTVNNALENRDVVRVTQVNISVGRFANVLPDALAFAFEALTQDGIMKGAKLSIEYSAAVAQCGTCGFEYEPEDFPFVCPQCKSGSFRIISGEEVFVQSIDCEENEER